MIRNTIKISIIFVICSLQIFACSEPQKNNEPEYILRTSLVIVTPEAFAQELDLKQSAYPYNVKDNPDEYNQMVIDLVKALSEETVLMSRAIEEKILVSDEQVDQAEAEFKKDYPDDSFDKMLLKNAISYSFWKKRFRKNLIIDELIDRELRRKIEITPQDLVDFYKKHGKETVAPSGKKKAPVVNFQNEKLLVSRLRSQKTLESYQDWIKPMWEKYPVDINKEKLKTFLIDIEPSKDIRK